MISENISICTEMIAAAFQNCKELESIDLNGAVLTILGSYTFMSVINCAVLTFLHQIGRDTNFCFLLLR